MAPVSAALTDGAGKPRRARINISAVYSRPYIPVTTWLAVCGERIAFAQSPPRAYYIRFCGKGLNSRHPRAALVCPRLRNSDFVTAPSRRKKYARINLGGPELEPSRCTFCYSVAVRMLHYFYC